MDAQPMRGKVRVLSGPANSPDFAVIACLSPSEAQELGMRLLDAAIQARNYQLQLAREARKHETERRAL